MCAQARQKRREPCRISGHFNEVWAHIRPSDRVRTGAFKKKGVPMTNSVVILGTRGSCPASGKEYVRYGGATSCYVVRLAGTPVIIDAGTGILRLGEALRSGEKHIPLILTHPHLDHLSGLLMCPLMHDPSGSIDL